jgi:hypothetical protein
MTGDIDGNGNKVLFGNVYSQLADLPSASTYHGMFAHVHATGKGYFAHAGAWVPLANETATLALSGGAMTGAITTNSTFDGRDVATDGTKLDGIEASATADQTKADIEGLGIDVPAANLTGTIAAARLSTAATQAESDDSTKIATTAYVTDKITTLIGGAPSTLNDLNELAAAINDDANYNTTLTTALGTKLPLAGGTMTGVIAGFESTGIDDNATSTAITIDASENVGIGTSSPDKAMHVKTAVNNTAVVRIESTATDSYPTLSLKNDAREYQLTAHGPLGDKFTIYDGTSGSHRFVIDTSGNVGIGTDSPSALLHVDGPAGDLIKVTSPGVGTGYLGVESGYTYINANTGGASLRFETQGSERMRIDASGNLLVGVASVQTQSGTTAGTSLYGGSNAGLITAGRNGDILRLNRQSSDGDIATFRKDGSTVGSIGTTGGTIYIEPASSGNGLAYLNTSVSPCQGGGAASDNYLNLGTSSRRFKDGHFSGTVNAANFNTTSDATLKTNVETLTGSLDAVKSLRGVSYDWIESGGSEIGVIAQEVEAVLPDVVSTNDEGIKSVKYGNMVAVLIEAIKEQQLRIEALEAQLNS